MAQKPITVIEVGTTRTVALIGRQKHDGKIDVLGIGTAPTTGVRKSNVRNMKFVTKSAESALDAAVKTTRTTINSVYLIHSGSDLQCLPVSAREMLYDNVVDAALVKKLNDNLHRIPDKPGRTTIDDIRQNYVVDDTREVENPEGMMVHSLHVNGLRLHMDANSHETMVTAVEEAQVEVVDTLFSAYGAAVACTEAEQKNNGVLLIDLGGGSTSWCVFKHGTLHTAGSVALGGDHITNDINSAFKLGTQTVAEQIKREHGRATLDGIDPTKRIPVPQSLGMPDRTISLKALNIVVNARIDETLRIVFEEIQSGGFLNMLGAGIVLCGGGALLRDLPALVSNIFRAPCGFVELPPGIHPDIDNAPDKIAFAPAYGALLNAAQIESDKEKNTRGGLFGGLFKRNGGDL